LFRQTIFPNVNPKQPQKRKKPMGIRRLCGCQVDKHNFIRHSLLSANESVSDNIYPLGAISLSLAMISEYKRTIFSRSNIGAPFERRRAV
jgi:hypothetical protein